jgi:hypothetical protein
MGCLKGWSFQNQGSFLKVMAYFIIEVLRNQSQNAFPFQKNYWAPAFD